MTNFTGDDKNDTWTGTDASEHAFGGAGDDTLNGGGGDDRLEGWRGDDVLTGGDGADTFYFAGHDDLGDDVITDFDPNEDRFYALQKGFTGMEIVGGDTLLTYPSGTVRIIGVTHLSLDEWNALRKAPNSGPAVTLEGTAGNDKLIGADGDDDLSGLSGDDYLYGGFGNDTLNGGDGDDRINGGAGDDILTGGGGADVFMFQQPKDAAAGFEGHDRITDFDVKSDRFDLHLARFTKSEIDGVDTVLSWIGGTIRIQGVTGLSLADWNLLAGVEAGRTIIAKEPDPQLPLTAQRLSGGTGDDTIIGGGGVDWLTGGLGDDILTGGGGSDLFIFSAPPTSVAGAMGADVITDFDLLEDKLAMTSQFTDSSVQGADTLLTWAGGTILMKGINTLSLQEWNAYATGDGDLDLDGSSGPDSIYGGEGDDVLSGGGGNDLLSGGGGDDRLEGGPGSDKLWGDAGDDVLRGGQGADFLFGGDGDDQLFGGSGNDWLSGGLGDDILSGGDGGDTFDYWSGQGGADTITDFDPMWDRIRVKNGFDSAVVQGADTLLTVGGATILVKGVNTLSLSDWNEQSDWGIYFPSDEPLILNGGPGRDWLMGGMGDDRLSGGGGDDEIRGGAGDDILTGGEGRDIFIFHVPAGHPYSTGSDTITDFEVGEDSIQLHGDEVFTAMEISGADTILHHARGEIRIVGVNGLSLQAWQAVAGHDWQAPVAGA